MNNHIVQDHKYQEAEPSEAFQTEVSEGSEEDDSQNGYQHTWQPPTQLHSASDRDKIGVNAENPRMSINSFQLDYSMHRQSSIPSINGHQNSINR